MSTIVAFPAYLSIHWLGCTSDPVGFSDLYSTILSSEKVFGMIIFFLFTNSASIILCWCRVRILIACSIDRQLSLCSAYFRQDTNVSLEWFPECYFCW